MSCGPMRSPAASAVWHYLNEPFLELLDTRNCCVSALADTIVTLGWPRFSTTETRLTGRPMKAHGPTATYCSDVCRCRYREPSIRMPMPRCDGQPRETQRATTRDTMVSSHVAAVTFVSGFTHSGHHSKAIVPAPHTAAHQRRRGMANCLHQVITLVNLLTG